MLKPPEIIESNIEVDRKILIDNVLNLRTWARLLKCLVKSRFKIIPSHCDIRVSHKYKFVAFLMPKAASTMLRLLMKELHKEFENSSPRQYQQFKYTDYVLNASFRHDDYFQWTVIRNPWERLFSCYLFLIHDPVQNKEKPYSLSSPVYLRYYLCRNQIWRLKPVTFEDFIKYIGKLPNSFSDGHFLPQHYFFDIKKMDFIVRFENLEADLLELFSIIVPDFEIKKFEKIYQSSISLEKKDYRDYYTDEMREIIARKYARDIELFNYKF